MKKRKVSQTKEEFKQTMRAHFESVCGRKLTENEAAQMFEVSDENLDKFFKYAKK